jgi:CheY-like chemotaxis protein
MARILIVDDSVFVLDVVRTCLEAEGHELLQAEGGGRAIEIFRTQKPDLAIIDLMMPFKDGFETMRELRGIDASAKIIAMSGALGAGAYDPLAIASKLGAQGLLPKPFALVTLVELVHRTLGPGVGAPVRSAKGPGCPLRVRFGSKVTAINRRPAALGSAPSSTRPRHLQVRLD